MRDLTIDELVFITDYWDETFPESDEYDLVMAIFTDHALDLIDEEVFTTYVNQL